MHPLILALAAALLFGASTPASKLLLHELSPLQLAGLLYLGAALATAPFARRERRGRERRPLDRKSLARLAGAVFLGGIAGPVLLLFALRSATSASVALLLNLELVATAALGVLVFREHLGTLGWIGAAAGLGAAVLLSAGGGLPGVRAGALVALACTAWGIENHLTALIDGLGPAETTAWKGLVAGTTNLALGLALDPFQAGSNAVCAGLVVGALSYGASIVLYVVASHHLGATRAQVAFSSAPFLGAGSPSSSWPSRSAPATSSRDCSSRSALRSSPWIGTSTLTPIQRSSTCTATATTTVTTTTSIRAYHPACAIPICTGTTSSSTAIATFPISTIGTPTSSLGRGRDARHKKQRRRAPPASFPARRRAGLAKEVWSARWRERARSCTGNPSPPTPCMRVTFVAGVAGLLSLLPKAPAGQLLTDTLLADINHGPAVVHGFGEGIASAGGLAYFQANDALTGQSYRLWRSDGTAAGTLQLATEALLVLEAVPLPDGGVFLAADELGTGVGLWRSDGTPAGTAQVQAPLDWTAPPHDLTVFGGAVWFLAATPGSGLELWRSDLATGLTSLVSGPAAGATQLFTGAGKLFAAHVGQGLVRAFDGTAFEVVAGFAVPAEGSCALVAQAGARVVFNVGGFGADAGWWASDGTPGGTQKVLGTFNDFWAASGDTKAYVTAGSVASTPLLWETDGTPAGTHPIDLPSTSGGQRVTFDGGLALGDALFYAGVVPGAGVELCRTNGAAGGATLVLDINPGAIKDSSPNDFVPFGGGVFFRADDGAHGREIWRTDPASGATALVADLVPGPVAGIVGSAPTLFGAQGAVLFGQSFAGTGIELGFTDGVQSGLLVNLGDEGESAGSVPNGFLRLGQRVVFQALDADIGVELWSSDGTPGGTQLLADIDPTTAGFPGTQGSFPHHFAPFGDRAYFLAFHPSFGNELWSTDGTAAGTDLVIDLMPGPGSSEPLFSRPPVALDDALYFVAHEPDGDFGLFRTDGTSAGTTLVLTTDPSGFVAELTVLVRVNDRLLFLVNGPLGLELWTSDGTAAGTTPLADMTPGPGGSFVREIAVGEGRAYLSVFAAGAETLWVTNGKPGGTKKFFDSSVQPGLAPAALATLGDRLFFQMFTPGEGVEPWTSDGTAEGTQLLLDIAPGAQSSHALDFTAAHDRVFFTTESPPGSFHHQELWISDGTPAGTALVAELPSPLSGAGIGGLWQAGADRRVLFSNVDDHGSEWWVSDGTTAGTLPLTDIAPGPKFAEPTPGAALGHLLLFAAGDGLTGVELHSLPLSATGGYAAAKLGQGCAGAHGTPELFLASGAPVVGGSLALSVEHAAPTSIAAWAWDGAYGALPPFGACAVQLAAPKLLAVTPTDAAGQGLLAAQVPAVPALAGGVVVVQVLALEPGGPFLALGALSDALELVVGP